MRPIVVALILLSAAPAGAKELTPAQYERIYTVCLNAALTAAEKTARSPSWTIYGRAYRNSFVQTFMTRCLVKNGVPPVVIMN